MTYNNIKELSIQVNLNGLSFCILNSTTKAIVYINSISFEEKLTPFETLNRLKAELASNTVFSEDFKTVKVIHHNELATLVPNPLYDEANNADYLKFNSKILKTDFIASDTIESKEIVSVYVPYVNINNYIFDTFGTFNYVHASTVFINALSKAKSNTEAADLFINVEKNGMQVIVLENGDIKLYNYFEFFSPEDFIYYVLFTCEQQNLDPETLKLSFSGAVTKDDAIYEMAYKYIRNVDFVTDSEHFLIKNSF